MRKRIAMLLAACAVGNAYADPPLWVKIAWHKNSTMSVDANRIKPLKDAIEFWVRIDDPSAQRNATVIERLTVDCNKEDTYAMWNVISFDASGGVVQQDNNGVTVFDIVPGSLINAAADFACAAADVAKTQKSHK